MNRTQSPKTWVGAKPLLAVLMIYAPKKPVRPIMGPSICVLQRVNSANKIPPNPARESDLQARTNPHDAFVAECNNVRHGSLVGIGVAAGASVVVNVSVIVIVTMRLSTSFRSCALPVNHRCASHATASANFIFPQQCPDGIVRHEMYEALQG